MDLRYIADQVLIQMEVWADRSETVIDNLCIEALRFVVNDQELWQLLLDWLSIPNSAARVSALMQEEKFKPLLMVASHGPMKDEQLTDESTTHRITASAAGPGLTPETTSLWVKALTTFAYAFKLFVGMWA